MNIFGKSVAFKYVLRLARVLLGLLILYFILYVCLIVTVEGRRVMPETGDEWGAWGTWVGSIATFGALVYAARQFKLQREAQERAEVGRLRMMTDNASKMIPTIAVSKLGGDWGELVSTGFTSIYNSGEEEFRDVVLGLAESEAPFLRFAVAYKEGETQRTMSFNEAKYGVRTSVLSPGETLKVEWYFNEKYKTSRWDWAGEWVPNVVPLPEDEQIGPGTKFTKAMTAGPVAYAMYRDRRDALWRRAPGDEGTPELLSL